MINAVIDRNLPNFGRYYAIDKFENGYWKLEGSNAMLNLKNVVLPVAFPGQPTVMMHINDIQQIVAQAKAQQPPEDHHHHNKKKCGGQSATPHQNCSHQHNTAAPPVQPPIPVPLLPP